MKVLFGFSGWPAALEAIRRHLPAGVELVGAEAGRPLAEQMGGVEVLLPSAARVGADVLGRAAGLRLIQQPAAGVDNLDLDAAKAHGIPVCNVSGHNAD